MPKIKTMVNLPKYMPSKHIYSYVLCVFFVIVFLVIRSPEPILKHDLFAEDGKVYLGGILSNGFWGALRENTISKGYAQLLKFVLAQVAIWSSQLLPIKYTLLALPYFVAAISYLVYGLCLSLPILLLTSLFGSQTLCLMVVGVNCLLNFGSADQTIVFGRILNVGFLSVYVGFVLAIFRQFVLERGRNKWSLVFTDFSLGICILTQPLNLLFLIGIWIDTALRNLFPQSFPNSKRHFKESSLFVLTTLAIVYIFLLIFQDLISTSYGQSKGYEYFWSAELFAGKLVLGQFITPIYNSLHKELIVIMFLAIFIISGYFRFREVAFVGGLTVVTAAVSILWRPGLLRGLPDVYGMPTHLMGILFLFLMASRIPSSIKYKISAKNIIIAMMLVLAILNGIDGIFAQDSRSHLSIEEGIELIDWEEVDMQSGLVEIQINPEDTKMKVPLQYVQEYIPDS